MDGGVSLDLKALYHLRLEEGIERILANAEWIDFSSHLDLVTRRCSLVACSSRHEGRFEALPP